MSHRQGVRDHRLLVWRRDDAHHVVASLGPPDVLELAVKRLAELAPLFQALDRPLDRLRALLSPVDE
jgi:hypothetical protein